MSANPKTVRLPFRAPSTTFVERWLIEYRARGGSLDTDPGPGAYLASYRLNPEWLTEATARSGERNVARFLRRLIATGRRGGIGRIARPAPSPALDSRPAPGTEAMRPQPARRTAYEASSKRVLLDLDSARRWLNEAGYFIAVQPTMKYYRQGRQLMVEDGGVTLQVLTMPENKPKHGP